MPFIMRLWVHVLNALTIFSSLLFTEYPGEIILLPAFIGYNESTLNMYLIATNCVERVCELWLCAANSGPGKLDFTVVTSLCRWP